MNLSGDNQSSCPCRGRPVPACKPDGRPDPHPGTTLPKVDLIGRACIVQGGMITKFTEERTPKPRVRATDHSPPNVPRPA